MTKLDLPHVGVKAWELFRALLLVALWSLSFYSLGRQDQRRFQELSYQDGLSAGVKLGCAARGKDL